MMTTATAIEIERRGKMPSMRGCLDYNMAMRFRHQRHSPSDTLKRAAGIYRAIAFALAHELGGGKAGEGT
jgi:hypothetical protein